MAGNAHGALKARARAAGVSVEVLLEHERRNEFWCSLCRTFHPRSAFYDDRSRPDGRARVCAEAANRRARERYVPRPTAPRGKKWRAEPRDGDKKQARGRVNYLVKSGVIPSPNDLPCADCGHEYVEGERHEYDHHLGYAPDNHERVQAVCSRCHRRRCGERGELKQKRDSVSGRYEEVMAEGG